jgi:hypothetical protein
MPSYDARPILMCPIGRFENAEPEIRDITAQLNHARAVAEKAKFARALDAVVAPLLECHAYNGDNTNCRLCREFSQLRRQTASLIVKMTAAASMRP